MFVLWRNTLQFSSRESMICRLTIWVASTSFSDYFLNILYIGKKTKTFVLYYFIVVKCWVYLFLFPWIRNFYKLVCCSCAGSLVRIAITISFPVMCCHSVFPQNFAVRKNFSLGHAFDSKREVYLTSVREENESILVSLYVMSIAQLEHSWNCSKATRWGPEVPAFLIQKGIPSLLWTQSFHTPFLPTPFLLLLTKDVQLPSLVPSSFLRFSNCNRGPILSS